MVKTKYIHDSKVYMHTAEFSFSNCISQVPQTIQKPCEENELDYLHCSVLQFYLVNPKSTATEFASCDGQLSTKQSILSFGSGETGRPENRHLLRGQHQPLLCWKPRLPESPHSLLQWWQASFLPSSELGVQHPASVGWMHLSPPPPCRCQSSRLPLSLRRAAGISRCFFFFFLECFSPCSTDVLFNASTIIHIGDLNVQLLTLKHPGLSNLWTHIFFFYWLCLWRFLSHLLPRSCSKPVITSNWSFSIISIPGLTLLSPPGTLRVLSF